MFIDRIRMVHVRKVHILIDTVVFVFQIRIRDDTTEKYQTIQQARKEKTFFRL